jgi:rhodanese-related sulfurtransferase
MANQRVASTVDWIRQIRFLSLCLVCAATHANLKRFSHHAQSSKTSTLTQLHWQWVTLFVLFPGSEIDKSDTRDKRTKLPQLCKSGHRSAKHKQQTKSQGSTVGNQALDRVRMPAGNKHGGYSRFQSQSRQANPVQEDQRRDWPSVTWDVEPDAAAAARRRSRASWLGVTPALGQNAHPRLINVTYAHSHEWQYNYLTTWAPSHV